jgi:predicted transcriptional regulator
MRSLTTCKDLVTGAEMFYDYTPESNQWTLPYNSLPKKEFETINGAFLDAESSATVILDSFGKDVSLLSFIYMA